jgi:hypothetical protein
MADELPGVKRMRSMREKLLTRMLEFGFTGTS